MTAEELRAAQVGDRGAFAVLYREHAPAVLRFFVANVRDRHTAEDLTATVFTDAWKSLGYFRGPPEAVLPWLLRIARHDLIDWQRARPKRDRVVSLDDHREAAAAREGGRDPQDEAVARVLSSHAVQALAKLSPDQREVILLRVVSGLSVLEVAAQLGKTVGATKALQHRGLTQLAKHLAHLRADTTGQIRKVRA